MKIWFDFEQNSWILKKFYVSSSVRNPGCLWLMGLKLKSYYQTCPYWLTSDLEKAVLFSKKWSLFSKPDLPVHTWYFWIVFKQYAYLER